MIYSQNDEQIHIENYFNGRTGRYLEIGVFDAQKFSNTYRLLELGWKGVGVEPDPYNYSRIKNQYGDNSNVQLIEAALSDKNGILKFYSSRGDGISTTDISHKQKWEKGWTVNYEEVEVPAITIQGVFNAADTTDFQFVSLDVEGTNWKLLQTLPLDIMKTELICVEYDSHKSEVINYCSAFGLTKILASNGENLIIGK